MRSYLTHCKKPLLMLALFPILMGTGAAQLGSKPIFVESWKKGTGRIAEQTLVVTLGNEKLNQENMVSDIEGQRRYKLVLRHHPPGEKEHQLEYWTVQLREILNSTNPMEECLGHNVLIKEQPGESKDFFPQEDLVGLLYPREKPKPFLERYYPINVERIVKVEDFYVLLRVNSYQLNHQNPRKLDSITITIEFRNVCDKCNY